MHFYSFARAGDHRNSKLGYMAKCSAPQINCSDDCALKGNGCYAENFPMSLIWAKQQAGLMASSCTWDELLHNCRHVPRGAPIRVWDAGDFPMLPDGTIDVQKLLQMKNAVRGKKAFAYTHHNKMFPAFNAAVSLSREDGFTINLSVDGDEDQLDAVMGAGLPAVIAVPSTESRRQWLTADGNRVRVCPNHLHKEVKCDSCMLCHTRPADLAIAFPAHGTKHKSANAALTPAQARSDIPRTAQQPLPNHSGHSRRHPETAGAGV